MRIGIVILNYNDYETTAKMIEKIKDYKSVEYKLVVDNMSTDDSFERLRRLNDGSWELIRTDRNGGYATGNNYGVKYLIKKYNPELICISNPDIIFDEDIVRKIAYFMESNEEYAVVTGVQTDRRGKVYQHAFWDLLDREKAYREIFHAFPIYSKLRKIGRSKWNKNQLRSYVNYKLGEAKEAIDVPVVSGCYFYIRTDDLKAINYFDENTFLFYEEDIMAWKLAKRKRKTAVLKDCKFIHLESESIEKTYTTFKKRKILYRSRDYYFRNYLARNALDALWYKVLITIYLYESQLISKLFF